MDHLMLYSEEKPRIPRKTYEVPSSSMSPQVSSLAYPASNGLSSLCSPIHGPCSHHHGPVYGSTGPTRLHGPVHGLCSHHNSPSILHCPVYGPTGLHSRIHSPVHGPLQGSSSLHSRVHTEHLNYPK
ncbi:hypothetical protein CRENBAI_020698 [Crenichthys baileyi]|uniref:Uncharacterized protein n=1 Tax=Crenichthys baileyi TaxID=28760 RepID=A0AAV9RZQ9_9TELE